ncbi:MAG: MFS transporter [Actinobacteria bacterium]|nr:MFS transporter [Actinomycetota bacterium]
MTLIAGRDSVCQGALGAVTLVGMGMGSMVPFAVSALAPLVIAEFGWSRTRYGSLITLTFGVGMLLSISAGKYADSSQGPRSLLYLLLASATTALFVLSSGTSYAVMAVGAAVGGAAMSLANPSTNKLISAFGAPKQTGLLIGIKQSGVQVGTFLSGVILPPLATLFGWRVSLRIAGAIPLICAFMVVLVVPSRWPSMRSSQSARRPVGIWWLMGYAYLMGGGLSAATYYLPLYAHERLGFANSTAGIFLSAVGVMRIASRVLAGHYANRIHDESWLLISFSGIAAVAQVLVWLAETSGAAFLWAGSLLLGTSAVAWNAVVMLVVVRRTGFGSAGHATGLVSLAFYGGLIIGPTLFGVIVDRTNSYGTGWFVATLHFVAALVVVLVNRHSRVSVG